MKNLEEIVALLPEKVWLTYVDYRDSLDEHHLLLQNSIHANNLDGIYEKINEWYEEEEFQTMKLCIKELRSEMMLKFDITKKEAKEMIEHYEDDIKNDIYKRNNSDVIKDLMHNTNKFVCFYDTSYEMESESWSWDLKTIQQERQRIKKILKIRGTDKYDDSIEDMIRMASYGGQLVVYFRINVYDFINENNEPTVIKFSNPIVAVVNHSNGSGWYAELPNHKFKMPYSCENVFIEKTIKYNFTYEVCGMSSDWCDATDVEFLHTKKRTIVPTSITNKHLEKENILNKIFKNGGCTFADMDINRHKNTPYGNDYPCGKKCTECGTFWID